MKIEKVEDFKHPVIAVGDIVEYETETCIVGYVKDSFIVDSDDVEWSRYGLLKYPYMLISLTNGEEVNSYVTLDIINANYSGVKLICKSENATLILK